MIDIGYPGKKDEPHLTREELKAVLREEIKRENFEKDVKSRLHQIEKSIGWLEKQIGFIKTSIEFLKSGRHQGGSSARKQDRS